MFRRLLRLKKRQVLVLWLLVIVFVLPLILFFHIGIGDGGPGSGGSAGVIFGRQVPWDVFQQEYRLIRRTLEEQLGQVLEAFEPFLRQQTWDRLILREEARRRIRVSDEELARFIRSQPTFQQEGRFVQELYERFTRGLGLSPQAFEESVRDDLRIQKLVDSVKIQPTLSDEELTAAYAKEHEHLQTALILIPSSEFAPQARGALTDEHLRAYYASHQEAVRLPAKRTIEYLGRSQMEAWQPESLISDEEIQAYYEDHQEELKKADGTLPPLEEVREDIRQRIGEEQAGRRLRNLALDLEQDLEEGLRFVEIALSRELLARRVGPIEQRGPGITNGPTASMLAEGFAVALGQMTKVLNEPSGVFVLMPIEEIPSRIPSFAEVKGQLEQLVVNERSREAAKAKATQLHDETVALRTAGLTFEEASLVLGTSPFRPAPFTRKGPVESLGDVPQLTEALFGLKPGQTSEVLEASHGFLIAFVEERLPIDQAQFAIDKEQFRQQALASKQQEHLALWLDTLRQQARLKSFLEESP